MAHKEEQTIRKESGSGEGCPVTMQAGRGCGRPIHHATAAIDTTPVCLMHSRDSGKDAAEFQREFEAILEAAGDDVADFTRFVFPYVVCPSREFIAVCVFDYATFTQGVDFWGATFTRDAAFHDATFTQTSWFMSAKFMQRASFRGATFTQRARFNGATFTQKADFKRATFTQHAEFNGAVFTRKAGFGGATFTEKADFSNATFTEGVNFVETTFQQDVIFNGGTFEEKVSFERARFLGRVEFRETAFRHDKNENGGSDDKLPGPLFTLAEFAEPEKVFFYRNYLGQALFYNCDVSRVNFSRVAWRRREGSRKWMVFEEEVDPEAAPDLKTEKGAIDYWLIVELYQQLKKNYDERKDYGTAGDFHYGELEMRRLATGPPGRIMQLIGGGALGEQRLNRVRRWWHQHFSLVALYKYASQYGESYARPLLCMALVLLLFTFLFPIVGLDCNDVKSPPTGGNATQQPSSQTERTELSYDHFSDFVKGYKGRKWRARPAFFGNSLMTALSVAGFQKELKYEPSYPWGRALALLELLLTSTLAALFLLAVRRQFRR